MPDASEPQALVLYGGRSLASAPSVTPSGSRALVKYTGYTGPRTQSSSHQDRPSVPPGGKRWEKLLWQPTLGGTSTNGQSGEQEFSVLASGELSPDHATLSFCPVSVKEYHGHEGDGWEVRPIPGASTVPVACLHTADAQVSIVSDVLGPGSKPETALRLAWPGFMSVTHALSPEKFKSMVSDPDEWTKRGRKMWADDTLNGPKVSFDGTIAAVGSAFLAKFIKKKTARERAASASAPSTAPNMSSNTTTAATGDQQSPPDATAGNLQSAKSARSAEEPSAIGTQLWSLFEAKDHVPKGCVMSKAALSNLGSWYCEAFAERTVDRHGKPLTLESRVASAAADVLFECYVEGKGPGLCHGEYSDHVMRSLEASQLPPRTELSANDILKLAANYAPKSCTWSIDDLKSDLISH